MCSEPVLLNNKGREIKIQKREGEKASGETQKEKKKDRMCLDERVPEGVPRGVLPRQPSPRRDGQAAQSQDASINAWSCTARQTLGLLNGSVCHIRD